MDLNALLDALGYLHSERHWVTPEAADPRLSHHYRLAHRAGEDVGEGARVVGSYTYETSLNDKLTPPRPAVFVAEAANEAQAREIHKRLWNLGDCPFLIMVLPGVVRVYTGFDYNAEDPARARVTPDTQFDGALADPLKPFHADAVDSGRLWHEQAKHLGSDRRVDYRLLMNLKELSRLLQSEYALSREVAHAMIGKYIYFRYLRDRGILDDGWLSEHDIRPEYVFGGEATAEGFVALAQALQARFNGDIFPLPAGDDQVWRFNEAIPFLVGIFNGNTTFGQLALDFQVYDFSYIPIELLSSIYEQFLKAEGRGDGDGVVYTPEALADFVLAEIEATHPLQRGHRVLDPCCGSGVFLVLAYRRLIEKLWSEEDKRPGADALKHLLQESIFGVEKDREACHIAAFSLILTLLSHLEPPELRANADFQFPTLVGENIYHADFFDSACPVVSQQLRFDWVIGNPPWAGASPTNPDHEAALRWIEEANGDGKPVGEKRLDEAFTWRAGDVMKDDGCAALLVMATTLLNSSSSKYRKSFFKDLQVRRITNLSNLRYILFMGPEGSRAKAPTACLVYQRRRTENRHRTILHFGPFLTNQVPLSAKGKRRRAWTITIYEGDVQEIDIEDAIEDVPYLWKTALWGSFQDRRALQRLARLLPKTISDVVREREWKFGTGPHIRSEESKSTGDFVPVSSLAGKRILETGRLETHLFLPDEVLQPLPPDRQFVRRRSGQATINLLYAPHILMSGTQAIYSDEDFVIPAPKVGIAAGRADADYLKATALYLNSSVARYALFFAAPLLGISIGTVSPENVGAIPFKDLSPEQVVRLASAYETLARQEEDYVARYTPLVGPTLNLQSGIDTVVEETMGIPESLGVIAREFLAVPYQLTEGKLGKSASQPPSASELKGYAEYLRRQVDDFARRHHRVTVSAGREAVIATVEATTETDTQPVRVIMEESAAARAILRAVKEQHSQWAYVERSVRIFDGPRVHIVKAARLLDWTCTQAVQDATDLISEVLDKTTPRYERATA